MEKSAETIETTMGELIAAIAEIALSASKSHAEGYRLATLTLADLLNRNRYRNQRFDQELWS